MFIPRDPVIENIFCKFAAQQNDTSGVGTTLAEAGAVAYHLTTSMDPINGSDTELTVRPLASTASGVQNSTPAAGFLEQAVKTDYHQVHPAGYVFNRDMAGSWAIAMPSFDANNQINGTKSCAVAMANLGIWETTFYTSFTGGDASDVSNYADIIPMQPLYVDNQDKNGKISNASSSLNGGNAVAVAITGVSADKAMKNANNNGKFSIKVKLLI